MELRHDLLTAGLVEHFAALLDREPHADLAPQGLHWCLCTPRTPSAGLGPDGHPASGERRPPRRMWASSEVRFLAPLPIGATIERRSQVTSQVEKQGASGRLQFVTVEHLTLADGYDAIQETQALVYREAARIAARTAVPPPVGDPAADAPWRRTVSPSPVLLFRYSALTFNSHRIHYDLPYAQEVEGYPGLVVHGPLLASLLLDLADRELGSNRLASFAFRAERPAFAEAPLTLTGERDGDGLVLAARDAAGARVMSAKAVIG